MVLVIAILIWLGWLAFAGWIIQINVNNIIAAGQVPDAWPIIWILLMLGLTLGSASSVKN